MKKPAQALCVGLMLSNALTSLNVAQAGDIVYVQTGTNPGIPAFAIPDRVAVLSVAPPQTVDTVEFSSIRLPLSGSGAFPNVRGTVTLGNQTEVSGFAIANVTGNGIQGANIREVKIRDNQITNASEQGINLTNVAGTSLIANNTITNSGNQGIFVAASGTTQQELTVNSHTINGSARQGVFVQASENAQQKVTGNNNTVSNSSGQGIFLQANNNSQQNISLTNTTINKTTRDSNGEGEQGLFAQANGGAQQQVTVNNTQVIDSASQGIFVSASSQLTEPTTRQVFSINNATVNNSVGQGIFVQANNNTQQQFAIANSTVNGTTLDSNSQGGQGIFTQANGDALQNFSINRTTVSNNAAQGIFMQRNGTSQTVADVQFNILQNNTIPGFYAVMNGNQTACVRLNGNNSNTNFVLQRNAGTFQIVDRDSVGTRNTGTVNFAPGIGNFTSVPTCP
jgi:hypothetical protein